MSLQMFATNEVLNAKVLAANKVNDIKGSGRSKYVKLKTEKLKSQKWFKSRKLSKNGNSSKFDAKENKLNFLTPNTREAFNCLQLAFTKALIL